MKIHCVRYLLPLVPLLMVFAVGCQKSGYPAQAPADKAASAMVMGQAMNDSDAAIPATPGHFDYYLLTLSWEPEYCHGHPNSAECDSTNSGPGAHGFVIHGLWPQYRNGQWPSHCSNTPGLSQPSTMLDIMPTRRLITHEWATHGTCTGLSASEYFRLVRKAYDSVRIPASLVNRGHTITQSPDEIKQSFVAANPGLATEDMAISCHNRYLAGVQFCLDKQLQPIACRAVRDCTARSIRIPSGK